MQPKLRGASQHDFGMESGDEGKRWLRPPHPPAPWARAAFYASATLLLTLYSCQSHDASSLSRFALRAHEETLALRGNWEFHAGDTIPNYPPDARNGFWQIQPVPSLWSQIGSPATGIAWYRTRLELPATLERSQNWALALRQFVTATEIYWDGHLLAQNGKVGATRTEEVGGWEDHIFVVPAEALRPGAHTIALRVSNHHWFDGGMLQPPEFGRYELLLERHEAHKTFNGFVAGLFLLCGIFHFILFVFNRSQREYWLMAVLFSGVTVLVVLFELPDLFDLNVRFPQGRSRLIWVLMMVVTVLMYRFLTTQFEYRHRGLTKLMVGGSSLMLLPGLAPVDLPRLRMLVTLRDLWFVVTLFIGIYVIMWAVRHNRPGSRVLAWGVLPLAAGSMLSTIRYESIWAFSGFTLFAMTMAISLSRKVAGIAAEVRRSRDVFRLFVPEQLLEKIATKGLDSIKLGSAEEGVATVLFTDIRTFASIAEKLSPGETLAFLNAFMQRMSPVIHAHGGFICQFVGDEIMAIFYMPEQAAAAVRCAVAMRRALGEHNRERSQCGEQPIEIGIGVNTGRVILGTIGSDTRMESCVIGDTVNLASRIQSLTKRYGVKILAAEATVRDLADATLFNHREVDVVQVKGISRPIAIYEIFDADSAEATHTKQGTLSAFQKGLQLFRTQQWQEAHRNFAICSDLCPEDLVAQIYLQRCEAFLKEPPGAGWSGVTVLQEK